MATWRPKVWPDVSSLLGQGSAPTPRRAIILPASELTGTVRNVVFLAGGSSGSRRVRSRLSRPHARSVKREGGRPARSAGAVVGMLRPFTAAVVPSRGAPRQPIPARARGVDVGAGEAAPPPRRRRRRRPKAPGSRLPPPPLAPPTAGPSELDCGRFALCDGCQLERGLQRPPAADLAASIVASRSPPGSTPFTIAPPAGLGAPGQPLLDRVGWRTRARLAVRAADPPPAAHPPSGARLPPAAGPAAAAGAPRGARPSPPASDPGRLLVGLFRAGTHAVVDVLGREDGAPPCVAHHPAINAAARAARDAAEAAGVPGYVEGAGEEEGGGLRRGRREGAAGRAGAERAGGPPAVPAAPRSLPLPLPLPGRRRPPGCRPHLRPWTPPLPPPSGTFSSRSWTRPPPRAPPAPAASGRRPPRRWRARSSS